jgi:hypothetical protein
MNETVATTQTLSGIATIEDSKGYIRLVKPGLAIKKDDRLHLFNGSMCLANNHNQLFTILGIDELNFHHLPLLCVTCNLAKTKLEQAFNGANKAMTKQVNYVKTLPPDSWYDYQLDTLGSHINPVCEKISTLKRITNPIYFEKNTLKSKLNQLTPPAITINNSLLHLGKQYDSNYLKVKILHEITDYLLDATSPVEGSCQPLLNKLNKNGFNYEREGIAINNVMIKNKTDVNIDFIRAANDTSNTLGYYFFDSNGEIIPNSLHFIWLDAKVDESGNYIGSFEKIDNLKETVAIKSVAADTKIGFFLITNGDDVNKKLFEKFLANYDEKLQGTQCLSNHLVFHEGAFYLVDNKMQYKSNQLVNRLSGIHFFTHDKKYNSDDDICELPHVLSGATCQYTGNKANYNNKLAVGFEHSYGCKESGFRDLVISVDIGENITQYFYPYENVIANTIDDGTRLSHIIITTNNFIKGDKLFYLPRSCNKFSVNISLLNNFDIQVILCSNDDLLEIKHFIKEIINIGFSPSMSKKSEAMTRVITLETYDSKGLNAISSGRFDVVMDKSISSDAYGLSDSESFNLGFSDDLIYLNDNFAEFNNDLTDYQEDSINTGTGDMEFNLLDSFYQNLPEQINFDDYGINKITLSASDVLELTQNNQKVEIELNNKEAISINVLKIVASQDDTIAFVGNDWQRQSTPTQGDLYYNHSESGDAYVLVKLSAPDSIPMIPQDATFRL